MNSATETALYILIYGIIGMMIISSIAVRFYTIYLFDKTGGYNAQGDANRLLSLAAGILLMVSVNGESEAIFLILPILAIMIFNNLKGLEMKHAVGFAVIHLFSSMGLVTFHTLVFLFKLAACLVIHSSMPTYGYNPFQKPDYLVSANRRMKREQARAQAEFVNETVDNIMNL